MSIFRRLAVTLAVALSVAAVTLPVRVVVAQSPTRTAARTSFNACHEYRFCFKGTVTQELQDNGAPLVRWNVSVDHERSVWAPGQLTLRFATFTEFDLNFGGRPGEEPTHGMGFLSLDSDEGSHLEASGERAWELDENGMTPGLLPLRSVFIRFFAVKMWADPGIPWDGHEHIAIQARPTQYTPAPEPGTWALLGTGLLAVGAVTHRRRRA